MWGSAFSSPTIATLAGQRQLLVQTRDQLAGVNLADGKVLWSQPIEAFHGMNILTPVAHKDTLFTNSYGGKTIGFKVAQADGAFKVTQSWTHKEQGYMSTPVVINVVAYEHLKSQRMMAIEVETGRELWTASEGFGKYASLVAQGDRILALDQRGLLNLLRANPKQFELLDKRRLNDSESWAHLAVAGSDLFVRELNALAAYHWTTPGKQASLAEENVPPIAVLR
jgi:outer membrane protein assembly factor BamB